MKNFLNFFRTIKFKNNTYPVLYFTLAKPEKKVANFELLINNYIKKNRTNKLC